MRSGPQLSKLSPPPLPADFVSRPRAINHLAAAGDFPIILVSAPAGYGKTLLVAEWMQHTPGKTAWITLDEGDGDSLRFLDGVVTVLEGQFPHACAATRLLQQRPEAPPFSELRTSLINDLAALPERLVLVLDSYQAIRGQPSDQLVDALVDNLPLALQLVLVMRGEPGQPIARLRARKQLAEIRARELAFTEDETREYLALVSGTPVRQEMASRVARRTEGWARGLQLVGQIMRREASTPADARFIDDAVPEPIQKYLLEEVLAAYPRPMQSWLARLSLLERFCAPLGDVLARGVHGGIDAGEALQRLWREGAFIYALNDRPGWFRFHQLLREALWQQLSETVTAEGVGSLHRLAGAWLADNDHREDALRHLLAAGETEAAVALAEEQARHALSQEQMAAVDRWLRALPKDLVEGEPTFPVIEAWGRWLRCRDPHIQTLLDNAERLLQRTASNQEAQRLVELAGEIAALRAGLCYERDDPERARSQAQVAVAKLPEGHRARSHAEACLVLDTHAAEDTAEAWRFMRNTMQWQSVVAPSALIPLLFSQARLFQSSTALEQLAYLGESLLNFGQRNDRPLTENWGHYLLGRFHYERDHLGQAGVHFSSLVTSRQSTHLDAWVDGATRLAMIHWLTGRRSASEVVGIELEAAAATVPDAYVPFIVSCRARLALAQGKHDKAIALSEQIGGADAPWQFLALARPCLTKAQLLTVQGTRSSLLEAVRLLQTAWRVAQSTRNTITMVTILATRALTLEGMGHAETALEVLERAVVLGARLGMMRTFLDLGAPMAALLQRLVTTENEAYDYGVELLARFSRHTETLHPLVVVANEALVEPLTERELEVLQMLAGRLTNREIAEMLGISVLTVKKHTINIYQKLNVQDRRAAVDAADRLGLIVDSI